MSRRRKILLGLVLTLSLAALAVVGWSWRRQVVRQRAAASYDSMLLPSRSQQLLLLADTLDREEQWALFRLRNFAGLWLLGGEFPVQNGFVGPHHQRLEVVFQRVRQDARRPDLFVVQGQMRLKGQITPLQGQIELGQVRQYGSREYHNPNQRVYTAVGNFTFWTGQPRRRVLQGVTAIDFETSPNQPEWSLYSNQESIHDSRGFAFEGYYYDNQQRQKVLWAADFMRLASHVLDDFNVGGRAVDINPKYARYGWDEYYRNDEWWTAAQP
ncbi:hypothetical protein [Hymenobacter chitinivorans]|uniref:Uncharacterized protein n=1 Tax=Hymenobacter chitinivorans DSM 11115 TaxID=1121954 RepID=A0A2M9BS12_9BACT|nr:hypothetical protein [Hymenobacter chitinivorans]PJJ60736.1 hypothetical protein CLV45_2167 [Hymenobacter chitinivorans DSM 11115]